MIRRHPILTLASASVLALALGQAVAETPAAPAAAPAPAPAPAPAAPAEAAAPAEPATAADSVADRGAALRAEMERRWAAAMAAREAAREAFEAEMKKRLGDDAPEAMAPPPAPPMGWGGPGPAGAEGEPAAPPSAEEMNAQREQRWADMRARAAERGVELPETPPWVAAEARRKEMLERYNQYRATIEAMTEEQKEAIAALFGGGQRGPRMAPPGHHGFPMGGPMPPQMPPEMTEMPPLPEPPAMPPMPEAPAAPAAPAN